MKKYLIAVCVVVICAGAAGFEYTASAKNTGNDEDIIENAIIIDSLSLTADKQIENNDDKDGSIIYDDSFDDGLRLAEKVSEKKKRKSGKTDDFMSALKSKDSKWHLSKYEIRKGDTLYGIARKFNTSYKLIIRANAISGPDSLHAGNTLDVPNRNGVSYKVVRGDTLTSISSRFKADMGDVKRNNDILDGKLRAGETIFIPDASELKKVTPDRIASRNNSHKKHLEVDDNIDKNTTEREIQKNNINTKRSVAFMWPLRGRITSGFGSRSDPFSGRRSFHNGIDISAVQGTPVKACAEGEVIFSGWKDGYGNLIVLKHKNGYISVYGHNSVLKKTEGDIISRGDIIALSGMTGAVTGAHLHFEIQKYQTPLNPLRMMK